MEILKTLEGLPGQPSSIDFGIALIYVGLGHNDQAMVWLNKAFEAAARPKPSRPPCPRSGIASAVQHQQMRDAVMQDFGSVAPPLATPIVSKITSAWDIPGRGVLHRQIGCDVRRRRNDPCGT
jgi:hypothetical protein